HHALPLGHPPDQPRPRHPRRPGPLVAQAPKPPALGTLHHHPRIHPLPRRNHHDRPPLHHRLRHLRPLRPHPPRPRQLPPHHHPTEQRRQPLRLRPTSQTKPRRGPHRRHGLVVPMGHPRRFPGRPHHRHHQNPRRPNPTLHPP